MAAILHQLAAVRTLRVSREFVRRIALAIENITEESTAEMLSSLDLIA